jgi:hypothetical protein
MKLPIVMAVLTAMALTSPAVAADGREGRAERRWHLGLEAGVDLPLFVSGRFTLESPSGIRGSVSGGVMPRPALQAITSIAVAAGGFTPETADLLASALKNPAMGRVMVGWRPWLHRGWFFEAGYAFTAFGSGPVSETQLAAALGAPDALSSMNANAAREWRVSSTLHMASLEIGHQWLVVEHLLLRLALGYTGTFWANTEVKPTGPNLDSQSRAYSEEGAAHLSAVCRKYVHVPILSFGIGYRFDGPPVID